MVVRLSKHIYYPTDRGRLRSKTTKRYKTSKRLYDAKGRALFILDVISYPKWMRNRAFITREEVSAERPHINMRLKETIEYAKIAATYSHMRKGGTSSTSFILRDYIIKYDLVYMPDIDKPTFKLEHRKGKNYTYYWTRIYDKFEERSVIDDRSFADKQRMFWEQGIPVESDYAQW